MTFQLEYVLLGLIGLCYTYLLAWLIASAYFKCKFHYHRTLMNALRRPGAG